MAQEPSRERRQVEREIVETFESVYSTLVSMIGL
jgi:hypothetical protein